MNLRILNLGAGVQSTTLAFMAHNGAIPAFDYAIFADTQGEPKAVYAHLKWLIAEDGHSKQSEFALECEGMCGS
ncbi:MAG: hypothetical protein ACE5HE_10650 [Phycisphaerae bacterium]